MALAAGARVQARALLRPWSRVPSAAPGRTPAAGGGGPGARCFGSPRVLVEPDPAAGVAVMKLRKPPVNSLSLELLTELVISLEKLENDKSFQGVIITSVGTLSSPGQGHRKAAVTSKSTPGTVGTSVVEKNQTGPDVDASVLCPQLLPRPDSREPPCSAVQARTQDSPGIFSAGLDLMEMCGRDPAHYAEYWKAVQELWLRLYLSHLVLICAVNGVSPAGGCLLALSCDYRILADNPKYTIGLNETQLGIVAPFWFADTLVNTIGHRAAERALQLGLLFPPAEALQVGIVDQVVPEDQVQSTARSVMAQWLAVPDHARQLTKNLMRKATADRLLKQRDADIQNFVSFISRDSIQKSLHVYVEKLQKKKG